MPEQITVQSEDHWHDLRSRHVGASEVAALWDLSPWTSRWELWHRKAGNLPDEDFDSDAMFRGRTLEPAIAEGVKSQTGWDVRKVHRYLSTDSGLGATLDYEVVGHVDGPGNLEIKTCDERLFRERYQGGEPPIYYQLQQQAQLAATPRRGWTVLATLVGGNTLHLHRADRHERTVRKIERDVAAFWETVASGQEPPLDLSRDAATVRKLYRHTQEGLELDLDDATLKAWLDQYHRAGVDEKAAREAKERAQAAILRSIGAAEKVRVGQWKVSTYDVEEKEISYTRRPYRGMRITPPKEDRE